MHASEDKERFVLEFASKLRQNGVDAWVDKWEMKLGDSLVHKIFEEGTKQEKKSLRFDYYGFLCFLKLCIFF